jgi:hypothetical protein
MVAYASVFHFWVLYMHGNNHHFDDREKFFPFFFMVRTIIKNDFFYEKNAEKCRKIEKMENFLW